MKSMWLVYLQWMFGNQRDFCVICKKEEDAKEYISKKLNGMEYSGLAVYKVAEIPIFELEAI